VGRDDLRPSTARELWELLLAVFPGFIGDCSLEDFREAEASGEASHMVMREFCSHYSCCQEQFSAEQLRSLGDIVNEAVTIDDDLENAIATCFLEHLHQVRGYKALAPYLSSAAKAKTHA
jgi:hypothetical protein